jgi:geranylgeranyl diphosphate synthase type 3
MSLSSLLAPYSHIAGLKSKNLRDAFIDAVNDVVHADEGHVAEIKFVITQLHNASLLLDDIEDGASRRRGQPAAHTIFGTPLTMNAANMIIVEALGRCIDLDRRNHGGKQQSAVAIFQEELALLHHGQGQDIYWRDTNQCPTEDEYRLMVENKTGGLFRLAVRLLMMHSGDEAMRGRFMALSNRLAFFFQVLDDYLNLCSTDYHEKKSFCEDLTEGKFSYLTTHSIRASASGDVRLQRTLQTRPTEVDVKRFCLSLMQQTGTFEHTYALLLRCADQIQREIVQLVAVADSDGGEAPDAPTPDHVARLAQFVEVLRGMVPVPPRL